MIATIESQTPDLDEPFVEEDTRTPEDRAAAARYWERERAIALVVEAQVAELIAEEALRREEESDDMTGEEDY